MHSSTFPVLSRNVNPHTLFVLQAHSDWNGRYLVDLVHADDVIKVKEQLCISDGQNSGK